MAEAAMLFHGADASLPCDLEACIVATDLYGGPHNSDDEGPDMEGLDIHHLASGACNAPSWPMQACATHAAELCFDAAMDPASTAACDVGQLQVSSLSSSTYLHHGAESEHACASLVQHDSCSGPMTIPAGAMPATSFALVRSCRARRTASLGLRAEALKTAWHLRTIRLNSCPPPPGPVLHQQQQQAHQHQDAPAAAAAGNVLSGSLDSALPLWDDEGALLPEDSDAIMAEILADELHAHDDGAAHSADACSGPLPMLVCLPAMQPGGTVLDACSPRMQGVADSPDHIFQDFLGAELSTLDHVGMAPTLQHEEAACMDAAAATCFSLPPPSVVEAAAALCSCLDFASAESAPAWQQQQLAPRAGRSPSSSASDASVLHYASAERSIQNSPRPSALSGQLASDSQATRSGLDLGPRSGSDASAGTPATTEEALERAPEAAAALLSGAEGTAVVDGSMTLATPRQPSLVAQQSASAPATPLAVGPSAPATGRAVPRVIKIKMEPGNKGPRSPRSAPPKAPKAQAAATKAKAKAGAARKTVQPKERPTGKGAKQAAAAAVANAPVAAASAAPSAVLPACQPAAATVTPPPPPPLAAAAPAPRPMLSSSCPVPASPLAALQALFEWQALSHRVVSAAAAPNQATAWDLLTDAELERFLAKMGRSCDSPATGAERREALTRDIKQCITAARMGKPAPA